MRQPFRRSLALCASLLVLGGLTRSVASQSLTAGSLRGAVLSAAGDPLAGVEVSLEQADGRVMLVMVTGRDGSFAAPLLQPGTYRLLMEQIGFQPVRYLGVPIAAAQTTVVNGRLERRPPPIEAVLERPFAGSLGGSALGPTVDQRTMRRFDQRLEGTDAGRSVSAVDGAREAAGLAASGLGLPPVHSRIYVDGVPEQLLRHPGVPGEPASAPLFLRELLAQGQYLSGNWDAEWRGYPGLVLSAHTLPGGAGVAFRPYASLGSTALAARTEDNPADSSAYSYQVGGLLSGAIVPDTAQFALGVHYQSLRTPSAYSWEQDEATLDGAPVSLRTAITEIASDSFGVSARGAVEPVVRWWEGLSGQGRVDWRIGSNLVLARAGYATGTERRPTLDLEPSNLDGVEMAGTDVSAALSVTSSWTSSANELRLGFSSAKREWKAGPLPATLLANEGAAFGGSAAVPGVFDRQVIDISDAVQVTLGVHRLKAGGSLQVGQYQQDYRYGANGVFTFGSLDGFARGEGAFFQTVAPSQTAVNPRITEIGVFLQDGWAISPEIALLLGVRYDLQVLPADQIELNQDWLEATGIPNDSVPKDRKGFSPRFGLVWDVQNRGEWLISGGAGLFQGRLDPSHFAEAILFDGRTTVRRGIGTFEGWPRTPETLIAPTVGPRLTLFNPTYRNPRTFKAGLGVNRMWPSGVAFRLTGLYAHTDYLLRRTDLNRVPAPLAETQEGRPVYGALTQLDGLVLAEPTTNRRFDDFDLVSGLAPTGFSDYAEVTAALERLTSEGLSFSLAYTFSRTEDNVPGQRAADPADQLDPFPEGLGGRDWSDGRSDFDVPHRFVGYAEYRRAGRTPVGIGARFRYRSGLPFTPGFRSGVDLNGDGGGNNDPAYVDAAISGVSGLLENASCSTAVNAFAARNSCREQAVSALDVRLEIGLPARMRDGGRLSLVLDAFNLLATEAGIVDRALLLVDPEGTLTRGGDQVTVPLLPNPGFGTLLSRRTEPRVFRVSLRMEY